MRLSFTKMQSLGNDFIVFEVPDDISVPTAGTLHRLADRRTGIGFDQALVLLPPPGTQASTRTDSPAGSRANIQTDRGTGGHSPDSARDIDIFYRIFNADGSEVEQCGNGARCVASLVARRLKRREVRLGSPGGYITGQLHDDGLVSVDMGVPRFDPAALPFEATREADVYPLRIGEKEIQIGAVSMGNPHAVIQVPAVAEAPVDTLGPAVENHVRFPRRTNVGFMEIVAPDHIRLRVHERGVGETRACGTGACGAVAIGRRRGLLQELVRVDAPGGRMSVHWAGPGQSLWLTGPAVTVFEGTVEI
ncbi:diaminopimelate epimerase [Steroidobacter denitrificans]|uniref:Diaminopimelate epimerase n=1 Tax=Steroidobacter denitrificans TaxID=465721 RepID=A0A127FEF5_STEDE|nr:diaminopimelate epimerase [Steroidobacter denitrificans]